MSRVYNVGGVEYPSVTTILECLNKGEGIQNWAVRCAMDYVRQHRDDMALDALLANAAINWRSVLSEAAGIGSEVHSMIEEFIATGSCGLDAHSEKAKTSFDAFVKWQNQHGVTWLKSEMQVVSHVWGYAGTLDAICLYEGRRLVLDFKTSGGFWDSYRFQIAAYRTAAEEGGDETDGCAILRLDKETGQPEFKDFSDRYERDREAFLKLTEYYYLAKDRRLKNNPHLLKREKPCAKIKLG